MNTFKMVVLIATIFFICKPGYGLDAIKQQHGIWVIRHNLYDKARIQKTIQNIQKLQIKDVYLQVRGRGYAYYNSSIEPISPSIKDDIDPLQYFLTLAKQHDLKVHVWINTYLLWTSPNTPSNKNHLYYTRKNWREKTIGPQTTDDIQYIYLSPHLTAVNNHIFLLVKEIVDNYDIAGIHLDYVRYRNQYYGFHESGVAEYFTAFQKQRVGQLINNKQWIHFKSYKINQLVEDIYQYTSQKNVLLSAAVKPNPTAALKYFSQDWPTWIDKGYIDYVVLMNYSKNMEQFIKNLKDVQQNYDTNRVYCGIGLWNKSLQKINRQLGLTKQYGINKIVLFSYDTVVEKQMF